MLNMIFYVIMNVKFEFSLGEYKKLGSSHSKKCLAVFLLTKTIMFRIITNKQDEEEQ